MRCRRGWASTPIGGSRSSSSPAGSRRSVHSPCPCSCPSGRWKRQCLRKGRPGSRLGPPPHAANGSTTLTPWYARPCWRSSEYTTSAPDSTAASRIWAAPKKGRSRGGRRSPLGNDLPAGSAASTEQTDRALVLHPSEDLLDELRAGRRHLSRQVAQGELLHPVSYTHLRAHETRHDLV